MKTRMTITAAALLALAACGDGDGTGPTTGAQVSLTFASNEAAGGAVAASRFAGPMAVSSTVGASTLDITSVHIVLREIELERVEVTDCDVEPEPDGCEKFETGPVLIDLPLDGSTSTDFSIAIDPGTYTEIEFDIHKVSSDDVEDMDFLLANPTMEGKSIRVEGTYDGANFTYETDLNEEQEFDLIPNLVIGEDAPATNVTVRFDVSTWFLDGNGNLFDPATANKGGPNENLAKDNIKNSIEAFEDEDKDGDDTDES
jgi:hypothetical protein